MTDATDPNYYEFPNGLEPRDISQYLTHAGGSAFDYIARACRVDGVHKHNRIEDLRKARDWLAFEIERIAEEARQDEVSKGREAFLVDMRAARLGAAPDVQEASK